MNDDFISAIFGMIGTAILSCTIMFLLLHVPDSNFGNYIWIECQKRGIDSRFIQVKHRDIENNIIYFISNNEYSGRYEVIIKKCN